MRLVLRAFLPACILLVFAGCSVQGGDSLLSPPNLPSEYVELEKQLNAILDSGARYITPETGAERQSVQLIDLNADGKNEAVAFFMMGDGALRAYFFEYGSDGYREAGFVEGIGARRLYSVDYIEFDGSTKRAIALSWTYDETQNRGLVISGYETGGVYDLLRTQYRGILYADGNHDGDLEIFTATVNDVTGAYRARVFELDGGEYQQAAEIPMCAEVRDVRSMVLGEGNGGETLIYIDSAAHGSGYVTDVISWLPQPDNLSMDGIIGSGSSTLRQASVFCRDIDNDGKIEVPMVEKIGSGRIDWYRYGGQKEQAAETYYSAADSWYMHWPESWQDEVSSQRTAGDGVIMTTFYVPVTAGGMNEVRNALLTVYVFGGENSSETLQSYSGVRQLRVVGNTVYAYSMLPNDFPQYALNDADMVRLFGIIEVTDSGEGY